METTAARVPEHGTYNEYHNHQCRCDACRRANTDYTRAARHARREALVNPTPPLRDDPKQRQNEERQTQRLLWTLYPRHDAFIRRLEFSWSAEVVMPGQLHPPYRTQVVAEASTLAELKSQLEDLRP